MTMPKKRDDAKKVVLIHLRISTNHRDRLGAEAERLGMHLSELLRHILTNYFDDQDKEIRQSRTA